MRFVSGVLAAILSVQPAFAAADARASADSIRQLFAVMHTSAMLDTVMSQIDTSARSALLQATAGEPLNEDQKRIMSDTQTRVMSLLKDELNWVDLEPMMIEVYRDSFSQKEVDGMLKFYRSEAGQAVIAKLPVVMRGMTQKMQLRMQSLTPKVVQLEKDAVAQLKSAARSAPEPQAPPPQSPPLPAGSPESPAPPAPPSAAPPPSGEQPPPR